MLLLIMEIKIIKNPITKMELKQLLIEGFDLVKAVVDIEKEIIAVGGELHMDGLELLMREESSEPKNIWGINLYSMIEGDGFIEFDSMVNLKPAFGNRTRGVDNLEIQKKIIGIVSNLIK